MVNDCSTDGSDKIIDEYDEKYDCCKAIHLNENSGGAFEPRNIGLEASTGAYIMFLDPDDKFEADACERLYNEIKENDADIVIARFKRKHLTDGHVEKSFSPFEDDLNNVYPNEEFKTHNPLNIPEPLYEKFGKRLIYSKNISKNNGMVDKIKINSLAEEPDLAKMSPSVWCKIYRKELIKNNNITFPPFVFGEDMAFNLECLINAKGIIFLNNYISYTYSVKDSDEVTLSTNRNFRLLNELMEAFIYCINLTKDFDKEISKAGVTPHLLNWYYSWKQTPLTTKENRLLLNKVNELKRIHNRDLKSRLIISMITTSIETAIHTKKRKNEVRV